MANNPRKKNPTAYNSMYDPNAIEATEQIMMANKLKPYLCVFIPESIMTDKYLSVSAKGLYAALSCIYAHKDNLPVISMMRLCHLGSLESFYNYRNELISAGYVDPETKQPIGFEIAPEEHAGCYVQTRVMMDQYLNIRQKGIYAYLQSIPGTTPSVKDLASALGITQMTVYRAYHMLASFSDKIPARWKDKCDEVSTATYKDYITHNHNNYLSSYIKNFCQMSGGQPSIFESGSYKPLSEVLETAGSAEKKQIQVTILNQASVVCDESLRSQLLNVASNIA